MSWVTNVMIHVDVLEAVTLDQINAAVCSTQGGEKQQFTDLTSGAAAELWGGYKYPEWNLYGAAFNYLQQDEVLAALRALPWTYPHNVQVFIKGEHDDRVTLLAWD